MKNAQSELSIDKMKSADRTPFALDYLNRITGNGIPNKTLNILAGGNGGFKSGAMCSLTADYLRMGKNVLYITLEIGEERVAGRITANLLDTSLDDLNELSHTEYTNKVYSLRSNTLGKLSIKEYPTASANAEHFRLLLSELELKDEFKPDVIMVDFIDLMTSSRKTMADCSYDHYLAAIAEELRELAVESDVFIWSATQTNRASLTAKADLLLALTTNEDLESQGQILIKQLKMEQF